MTFALLLSEALASPDLPSTGDVLAVGLPLLRQLDDLHEQGTVSRLRGVESVVYDGVHLHLRDGFTQEPTLSPNIVRLNPPRTDSGVEVSARFDHTLEPGLTGRFRSRDVFDADDQSEMPDRPMFVVGYRAWEQLHGHHDELTDVHLAGLLLVSYATGLDLTLAPAVDELALAHRHLLRLNPSLHPVVANVLSEMVTPDRHARPRSMGGLLTRLEHHRELPSDLDLSEIYAGGSADWRRAVLSNLRERVFDTSRRNRALYFRPSSAAISLTEASVPLLLNVERIAADDLLTWNGATIDAFRPGKPVDLERWCRFEESPHLAPGLEKLISSERKLRAEHGHGRLRLVIAFLRWVDPENNEVVNSPLLTLPAELTKKKGVKERFRLEVDVEAALNPVLRHVLSSRFGIELPESIESDHESITALVAELERKVQSTDPGLTIDVIDKPRISLIRRRAQLRVDAYLRRRAQAQASSGRWRRNDYSYDRDDWRPLGLSLYRRFVEPQELPLRTLAGADPTTKTAGEFAATRERETFAIASGDVSRQRWEVDLCAVTLASLGSRRSTLARDYDELLESASEATPPEGASPFDLMFSPERRKRGLRDVAPISVDQTLVLPADSTQAAAVRRGLHGDSFIIQGPPGTGKSQTITNLIAGMVADGKRVLFVCEKRAALDVVAHRLRQVGLGPIVATIHDAELDRRPFIAELSQTHESWNELGLVESEQRAEEQAREHALAEVEALLHPLEIVFADLHQPRLGDLSVSSLIERLVVLRANAVEEDASLTVRGVDASEWVRARPALDRTQAALVAAGLDPDLSEHAVLRVAPSYVQSIEPLREMPALGAQLRSCIDQIVAALPDGTEVRADDVGAVVADGDLLATLAARGAATIVDDAGEANRQLRITHDRSVTLRSAAESARPAFARWSQPLSADDARNGLELATQVEHSLGRFFNGRWRHLKKLVRSSYRFDQHQVEPSVTQVLAELVAAHAADAEFAAQRRHLTDTYGTEDSGRLLAFADRLVGNPIVEAIAAASATTNVTELLAACAELDRLRPHILVSNDAPLADFRTIGAGLGSMSVAYERAVLAWAGLHDAPASVVIAALTNPKLDRIERAVFEQTLATLRSEGSFGDMTSAQLDDTVSRLMAAYRRLLGANGGAVLGRARARFSEHVAFSEASMAGRSDDDKDASGATTRAAGYSNESSHKKMRFRPIRELASGDSGLVRPRPQAGLADEPAVGVRPLCRSTSDLFDVVVFDEASQIPVEDAVPTLYRGTPGDRGRRPHAAAADPLLQCEADDEDECIVDDDGHRLTISLDADSFLTQADQALDSVMLSWHYRSRSESLIDYSNHAFYDGRLATVPDRSFDGERAGRAGGDLERRCSPTSGGHAGTADFVPSDRPRRLPGPP